MPKRLLALIVVAVWAGAPAVARAQEGPDTCGVHEGVVCDGWFTDDAGITSDEPALEAAVARVIGRHGNQIAFVVVDNSGGRKPADFAAELGNAWGVGDAVRDDGIVVLVDLQARRTEISSGPGVRLRNPDRVAGAGNSFFGDGKWDAGMSAIIGSLEQALAAGESENGAASAESDDDQTASNGSVVAWLLGIGAAIWAGGAVYVRSRRRKKGTVTRREALIDADLDRLEPAGHELPLLSDFAIPVAGEAPAVSTSEALDILKSIEQGLTVEDTPAFRAVWSEGLTVVVDHGRLTAETGVPLELRASGERAILEDAVQRATKDALDVPVGDEKLFEVRRDEVERLVDALRPHRVAAARRRIAEGLAARLVETPLGAAILSDEGERFLRAGAALDSDATLSESLPELRGLYSVAMTKAARLESLYEQLPDTTARPAVAAALADVDENTDESVARYERLRSRLEPRGDALVADGLSVPAIAALLLMNNNEDNVDEFVEIYEENRARGLEPHEAVEYALAGLQDRSERERVRSEAKRLGLSISITAALLRRRDDGPEVFDELMDDLAGEDVTGDARRTVAAVLAISLEPAQALRRWIAAREALAALGLTGTYADVAAAFGASDPRGPRTFALAYAAQRQALARSTIDDADRFAPELAHEGTQRQTDTWTGDPISGRLADYDPFTLLYYHWVVTRGHGGSYGWEPVYADSSWSGDRESWLGRTFGGWGGGGGFGGGSGGGSSWGGGGWGGSGGGFGGGGGFSGGGGGGSGW